MKKKSRIPSLKLSTCWLAFLFYAVCVPSSYADNWAPVKDSSLMIEPGSILDFSSLLPALKPIKARVIINPAGQFAFDNQPDVAQRFLIASLPVGLNNGGFPSHEISDLYG